jgi:hypothetical protein
MNEGVQMAGLGVLLLCLAFAIGKCEQIDDERTWRSKCIQELGVLECKP